MSEFFVDVEKAANFVATTAINVSRFSGCSWPGTFFFLSTRRFSPPGDSRAPRNSFPHYISIAERRDNGKRRSPGDELIEFKLALNFHKLARIPA
jgi:hypothetical protein